MGVYIYQSGVEKEMQNAYIGEYPLPGSNTIAYYPLNGTLNDESGNSYNLSNNGTSFYNDTSIGRQILYCDGNYHYANTTQLPSSTTNEITLNIWSKGLVGIQDNRNMFHTNLNLFNDGIRWETSSGNIVVLVGDNSNYRNPTIDGITDAQLMSWGLWTITYSKTTKNINVYYNGAEVKNGNTSSWTPTNNWLSNLSLGIGFNTTSQYGNRSYYGYLSEVILENKVRTEQEIANYYNQTKGDYGL